MQQNQLCTHDKGVSDVNSRGNSSMQQEWELTDSHYCNSSNGVTTVYITAAQKEMESLLLEQSWLFGVSTRDYEEWTGQSTRSTLELVHPLGSVRATTSQPNEEWETKVEEMVDNNIISPSNSPWSLSIVLVKLREMASFVSAWTTES
jgi:hypothetical protein